MNIYLNDTIIDSRVNVALTYRECVERLGMLPTNIYGPLIMDALRKKCIPLFPANSEYINIELEHVKAAYKLLVVRFHPDKTAADAQKAEIFKKIVEAYEYLTAKLNEGQAAGSNMRSSDAFSTYSAPQAMPSDFYSANSASQRRAHRDYSELRWPSSIYITDYSEHVPGKELRELFLFFKTILGSTIIITLKTYSENIHGFVIYESLYKVLMELNPEIKDLLATALNKERQVYGLFTNFSMNNTRLILCSYKSREKEPLEACLPMEQNSPSVFDTQVTSGNLKFVIWVSWGKLVAYNLVFSIEEFIKLTLGGHVLWAPHLEGCVVNNYLGMLSENEQRLLEVLYHSEARALAFASADKINNFKADFSTISKAFRTINNQDTATFWNSLASDNQAMYAIALGLVGAGDKGENYRKNLLGFITSQNNLYLENYSKGTNYKTAVWGQLSPEQQHKVQAFGIESAEEWNNADWQIQHAILPELASFQAALAPASAPPAVVPFVQPPRSSINLSLSVPSQPPAAQVLVSQSPSANHLPQLSVPQVSAGQALQQLTDPLTISHNRLIELLKFLVKDKTVWGAQIPAEITVFGSSDLSINIVEQIRANFRGSRELFKEGKLINDLFNLLKQYNFNELNSVNRNNGVLNNWILHIKNQRKR